MLNRDHVVEVRATHRPGVHAVRMRSSCAFGRHSHDQFGIGVIAWGAQASASGRGPVEAEAGQLISVNPGEVHDGRPLGEATRTWHMLYLDPEVLAPVLLDATEGRTGGVEFAYPVRGGDGLGAAFRRLYRTLITRDAKPDAGLAAEVDLLAVVAGLVGRAPGAADAPTALGVRRAIARIDDAPEVPVSLAELAAIAGFSAFHLVRLFKAATGLPPHGYRLQRQVQHARRLLAVGIPPAEAALEAGFADQSHLTRHYVRAYGVGPGAYAKAMARRPTPPPLLDVRRRS